MGKYNIVGYAFQRGTDIATLDVSKVTHLNYAFGLIYNKEYLDINPATGRPYGSPTNVDVRTPEPVPDGKLHTVYLPDKVWDDLSRLELLRRKNPDLKILLSVGGWEARGFCDVAMTAETRRTFALSVKEVMDEFQLNGIDLDWEYPVNGGGGVIKARPEDKKNFTLLLEDVRNASGDDKLLTIAGAAHRAFTSEWTEFRPVMELLDYINIMSYDYQFRIHFGSALYMSKRWRTSPDKDYDVDTAVRNYIDSGAAPEKINLGLAFAAPIPQVVKESPAWPEIDRKLADAGFYGDDVTVLERIDRLTEDRGFSKKWDDDARNMYVTTTLADGTEHFVLSYIEEHSITAKTDYVKRHGLGGVMFWQFGADRDNSLVTHIHDELNR